MSFHSGDKAKAYSGTTDMPGGKWSMTVKGNNKDVSNSRDGRKRISGLQDAEGTVEMPYDSYDDPTATAAANLRSGNTITFKLYVDTSKFYQVTGIIDEVTPSSEIEGEVKFMVKWSMESGTVTYPV